ncbi:MAG: hypothetical protein EAX96_10420 [Candidatus Lokiarchaeota archaeon]|nr:hypothetical protein [Candidatus Lokiarchaeota archaeon]
MSKEKKEPTLFVKAAIRKYVNTGECNIAGEVINGNALNNQIKKLLDLAIERAQKAKRKTLMAKDFRGIIPSQ